MRARSQLLLSHEELAGLGEEEAKQRLLQMGEERHAEKREGLATLNNKVNGGQDLPHHHHHRVLAVVCATTAAQSAP